MLTRFYSGAEETRSAYTVLIEIANLKRWQEEHNVRIYPLKT
jgi:hypothetical protein